MDIAETEPTLAATDPHPWDDELRELYQTERLTFTRVAYLICGEQAVAEELVQEAFIACADRWDTIKHPRAYVRMAVVNRCRDWLKRRKMKRERTPVASDHSVDSPDEMWDALQKLEPRRRAAIVLRFYEDLSVADTAVALGCRPGTVRSLVHRGLKDLGKEIKR